MIRSFFIQKICIRHFEFVSGLIVAGITSIINVEIRDFFMFETFFLDLLIRIHSIFLSNNHRFKIKRSNKKVENKDKRTSFFELKDHSIAELSRTKLKDSTLQVFEIIYHTRNFFSFWAEYFNQSLWDFSRNSLSNYESATTRIRSKSLLTICLYKEA